MLDKALRLVNHAPFPLTSGDFRLNNARAG